MWSCCIPQEIESEGIARKVMEEIEHVMLVGKGAQDFALSKDLNEKIYYWKNQKKLVEMERNIIYKHPSTLKITIQLV